MHVWGYSHMRLGGKGHGRDYSTAGQRSYIFHNCFHLRDGALQPHPPRSGFVIGWIQFFQIGSNSVSQKHLCLPPLALNKSPIFIPPSQQLANWSFGIALDGQISSTICCNLEESSAAPWQLSGSEAWAPEFICQRGHVSSVKMAIFYKKNDFSSNEVPCFYRGQTLAMILQNIAPKVDADKIVLLSN